MLKKQSIKIMYVYLLSSMLKSIYRNVNIYNKQYIDEAIYCRIYS